MLAEVEEWERDNTYLLPVCGVELGTERNRTEQRAVDARWPAPSSAAPHSQAPFVSSWLVSAAKMMEPDATCPVKLLWFSRDGKKVIFIDLSIEVYHQRLIFLRVLGKSYDIKRSQDPPFDPVVDLEMEILK